jgi:hypothetical protein
VAQGEDFPIERVELVQRPFKERALLRPRGLARGALSLGGQLVGDHGRARFGSAARGERDLPADVPQLGPQVMAVKVEELLSGQEAKPDEWGHLGRPEVLRQPLRGLEEHLLDDVRWVQPGLEAVIEAQADHALQPLAVPHEDAGKGFLPGRAFRRIEMPLEIVRGIFHISTRVEG